MSRCVARDTARTQCMAFYVAISYELTGNEEVAVQTYQGVEALISESASAKNKSLVEWSEESLYRATLLGLKKE